MTRYDVHVVPQGEGWAVIREGDDDPVSLHAGRVEAERAGRQLASDGDVGFAVHARDGGSADSFDDDPRLSEG